MKFIKILLTIVAIMGLALVPQASYAEEANNACVAGSPCGEAKFYDVNENEILSVQMSYSTDKFQEKIHLPVGKYHIKTSVIGLENGHNSSSSEKLYTFDIYGNIEVKDNEVASFRTFVGNTSNSI